MSKTKVFGSEYYKEWRKKKRDSVLAVMPENERLKTENAELRGELQAMKNQNQRQESTNASYLNIPHFLHLEPSSTENAGAQGELQAIKNQNIRQENTNASYLDLPDLLHLETLPTEAINDSDFITMNWPQGL